MPSLTEAVQTQIRSITGTAGQWVEDWHALFNTAGLAAGNFGERLVAFYRLIVANDPSVSAAGALNYFLLNPSAIQVSTIFDFTTGSLDPDIAWTRTSQAWYYNSAGTLTAAAANEPRFDYHPVTLAIRGLLIEPTRINSIRNNSGVGAVAGTPGTLPTNWATALPAGITREVVGTGTENGIPYTDVRFSGTTADAVGMNLFFETTTGIAAANAQMWSLTAFIRVVAGAMPAATPNISFGVQELDGVGTVLATNVSADFAPDTTGVLRTNREAYALKLTNAGTTNARPRIRHAVGSGVTMDYTLRIGAAQFEQGGGLGDSDVGAYPTSPILTTGSAFSREQDGGLVTGAALGISQTASTFMVNVELGTTMRMNANCFLSLESDVNERAQLRRDANDIILRYSASGGAVGFAAYAGEWDILGPVKYGATFGQGSFSQSFNGAIGFTDVQAAVPVLDKMAIGFGSGSQRMCGWLRTAFYAPRKYSDAELNALTA